MPGAAQGLKAWTDAGYHGGMAYMVSHGDKRAQPAALWPGTQSIVTVMLPYLPATTEHDWQVKALSSLEQHASAYVSLYARGRDYHKVMRSRLKRLAATIALNLGGSNARVFTDSAPVLEVELASRSGLGWRGKHTLLLSKEQGSMFFLGEIFLDLPLPPTPPITAHCGSCERCIQVCPTQAIVAPYRLDARRCISYLTIEHHGPIPIEMRRAIGNRIYGCDDCQLVCPWNKYAQKSSLSDFQARAALHGADLTDQLALTQHQFEALTEGSPIRRIGHERWQRNVAVACGNALASDQLTNEEALDIQQALNSAIRDGSDLVAEHAHWALNQKSVGQKNSFAPES